MSKTKLIFGSLIIMAIITAGCSGTKTMVGNEQTIPSAGQTAALNDYKKYAGELSDEIGFMKNHYPLSPNATLDEYRAWLDGFGEKLALCRQMYNNTSAASNKYMGYLNNSSDEYRNVTAADAGYVSDIELLNRTYWNHSEYLNTYVKKMAALEKYTNKLNSTMDAYNDLSGLAKDTKIDSLDAYSRFIGSFKNKATAYESSVDAAVAAGDEYASYCEPGSEEYKALQDNNNALKDGVTKCWDTYDNYKKDYDSKAGASGAIQSTFKDYVDKVRKASAIKNDLDTYRGTAKALEKLDKSWLDGYKQKIDAFDTACNDAIASGNACKQYLDKSGSDYKGIETNEKNMKDSMATYDENYNKMNAMYRNLHPLGSLI
jgi:chromosome segregation ATPase